MKLRTVCTIFFFLLLSVYSQAQQPVTWTPDQLLEPAQLAQQLESGTDLPVLICVGPGAMIPHSMDIGPATEKENLAKLRDTLQRLDRKTPVVVYCGCCPFDRCPNVRPALALLKDLHFTQYKLLNLPHNLKTDWLDKGYPAAKL